MDRYHHASAVIIGDKGVVITGASGVGKSTLARHLIDYAHSHGRFAALIGDDRIAFEATNGRIIAAGHAKIAGLIEIRGLGLAQTNFVSSALIDLLVSCETVIKTRLPDEGERMDTLLGVHVPRIETRPDDPEPVWIALGYGHLTVQN
jgi:serine kinase of HPr protein (carbohydrate metabolism regulator)